MEQWVTDADLVAAFDRFRADIAGYALPAAYGVASANGDVLTFGHVNKPGEVRPLPAVVLATVCGHATGTAVHRLTRTQFSHAATLLAPAEFATHKPHPNLWSWRRLLEDTSAECFVAFFLREVTDPILDEWDAAFRRQLVS